MSGIGIAEGITPEQIKANIFDALTLDFDTREGSYLDALTGPIALELWKAYQAMDNVADVVYLTEDSPQEWIIKRCGYYGIVQKPGSKATVTLTATGVNGTVIKKGKFFLDVNGLEYVATSDSIVANGVASIPAEAMKLGAEYNREAGAITRQMESQAGITSVTSGAAEGGADPEAMDSLITRYYTRLRRPSTSGNAYSYEQWALEVDGVGAAKVTPIWNGAGTVKVALLGPNKQPVDNTVVTRCSEHIEDMRPIGAAVTVVSAQGVSLDIEANVILTGEVALAAIKASFEASLEDYLATLAFNADTVPYAKIGWLLLNISGVADYSGLTVNGGIANITLTANQVPVKGTVTLT